MLDLPARSQTGAQTPALAEALARHAKFTGVAALPWRGFGLAGRVLDVYSRPGDQVAAGQALVAIGVGA